MLEKLEEAKLDQFIEIAWRLSQNRETSSYPTFMDGIKTKTDFVRTASRSFAEKDSEILLYFAADKGFGGWIQYYDDLGDNSVSLYTCLSSGYYQSMMKEFVEYIRSKYPAVKIGVGFPMENVCAISTMEASGFSLIEESENHVLQLKNYRFQKADCVRKIEKSDFGLFKDIHDANGIEMYWNSERIFNQFNLWNIYVYERGGTVLGALYALNEKILLEIFGIDFRDNHFDENINESLLTAFLNDSKTHKIKNVVYFSDREQEEKTLARLGFSDIGGYRYFELK